MISKKSIASLAAVAIAVSLAFASIPLENPGDASEVEEPDLVKNPCGDPPPCVETDWICDDQYTNGTFENRAGCPRYKYVTTYTNGILCTRIDKCCRWTYKVINSTRSVTKKVSPC
ncbi:MAG: hypothetical protein SF028_13515 [Candidatus Sumerlaeia bacterium]|nr:hypothetical protein [Candidatus Sumerlaeia bacterium]